MPRTSEEVETYDRDNPQWTAEDQARAVPFRERFPHIDLNESVAITQTGQQASSPPGSNLIYLQLPQDLADALRAIGPDWQGAAEDILRTGVEQYAKAKTA